MSLTQHNWRHWCIPAVVVSTATVVLSVQSAEKAISTTFGRGSFERNDMNLSKRILKAAAIFGFAACSILATNAHAQTTLLLCLSPGGNLRAMPICRAGDTVLSAANIATALKLAPAGKATSSQTGSSLDLSTCYTTRGQRTATAFDGRVELAVQCSKTDQVVQSYEFSTSETSGAKPTLERVKLIYSGKLPNGIELGTIGASNKLYSLSVALVCCSLK